MLEPELDVSGGKVERPILSGAIEGVEDGRFAGIIVAQLDRLSRMDIADALQTIRRIENAGGEVIAVAENFDAGTPEGRMARNVILAMGEMQLDRYRAQFDAAKRSAVARGIWPTPKPPLGYKRGPDRRLVPDRQAGAVVRAFEARAAGASWSKVADILNGSTTNATKVIRNPAYLGHVVLGQHRNTSAHPAIIPRDLWEAAQLHHPRPPRGVNGPALLSGIVRCASCQRLMTPETGRDKRYRCFPRNTAGRCNAPATVAMSVLDPYVEAAALEHLERLSAEAAPLERETDGAIAKLNAAEAELAAYQEMTQVSDIGAQHFLGGMQARVEAVQAARKALADARVQHQAVPDVSDLGWDDMTVEERRHVLRGFLGAVYVRKGVRNPEGRVRIVVAGSEAPFPNNGDPVVGLDWPDGDLPGEIRSPLAKHVAEPVGSAR
jgi:DNA invertase Pin-like site-specific DNA recombinase